MCLEDPSDPLLGFSDHLVPAWLEGLAALGLPFMELDAITGDPCSGFKRYYTHYVGRYGLMKAVEWLVEGSQLALLLDPTKRLYVVDADDQRASEWMFDRLALLGIEPLYLVTNRGAHFYFLLPEGSRSMA